MVEVYAQTKPAVGRRATIAAAGLLALACLLAWWMTRTRAERPQRVRIEPAGWSISFEAPFRRYQEGRTATGYAFSFFDRRPDESEVVVSVHRVKPGRGETLAGVADRVTHSLVRLGGGFLLNGPVYRFDKRLGSIEAVEVWEPDLRVVVRAGRGAFDDEAYAVSMQSLRILDPPIYAIFDSVCASVDRR